MKTFFVLFVIAISLPAEAQGVTVSNRADHESEVQEIR